MRQMLRTLTNAEQISRVRAQIGDLMSGAVLRLKKACYGLKQAPRQWWKKFHAFLKDHGFRALKSDPCLYILHLAGGAYVMLLLYVDDIILAATSQDIVSRYAKMISGSFRVSSEGPLESYLGVNVKLNLQERTAHLEMRQYVENMYKRFGMSPKQSVDTPLPDKFLDRLSKDEGCDLQFWEDFQYREKLGCALYYMICMRPDIVYAVSVLASYADKPNREACAGLTRLLQYLYNTRFQTLQLGGLRAIITAYFDADWAGDPATRRSMGCFIVYLGSGPIGWKSEFQRLTAQSTAEAEFIAGNKAARLVMWVRSLLKETGIQAIITRYASTMFGDNTACLAMAENPVHHERTKHIAIIYFLLRDLVEAGVIVMEKVPTEINFADIGTKSMGPTKYAPLAVGAMGHGVLLKPTKRVLTEVSDEFA